MFRLNVTESMRNFIKLKREEYNAKATDLTTKIDKSNAYLSKLDKGDYKTIGYNDLCRLLSAICDKSNTKGIIEITSEGKKLVDEFLTDYILTVDDFEERMEEDFGLTTFDNVLGLIEIPKDLVDFINSEITKNELTISQIVDTANQNKDLSDYTNKPKYEFNIYYPHYKDEENQNEFIEEKDILVPDEVFVKVHLDEKNILDILQNKVSTTNYITMQSLLYTISRIKPKGHGINLSLRISESILSRFQFHNLRGKRIADYAEESKRKAFDEMNSIPSLFVTSLNNFTRLISSFYRKNPDYTISKIIGLHQNLSTDSSLVIALLDMPLHKLKDLEIDEKRKLCKEIDSLIIKYSEIKPDKDNIQII